jgi:hypothetical protein
MPTERAPSGHGPGQSVVLPSRLRVGMALAALALSGLVVLVEPWHGAIVISAVAEHGFDAGDLLALPLVVVALWLVGAGASRPEPTRSGRIRSAASAWAVGSVLLAAQAARLLDIDERISLLSYLLLGFLGLAVAWFVGEQVAGVPLQVEGLTGRIWMVGAAFLVGLVVDLLLVPLGGTLFSAIAAVSCAAVLVRSPLARGVFIIAAAAMALLTVASLTDLAGIDVVMAKDQGGGARSVALGLILVTLGGFAFFEAAARPDSGAERTDGLDVMEAMGPGR